MDILKGITDTAGGVVKGAGDLIGGVADHLGTGFKAVRDAERAKLAQPGIKQMQAKMNAIETGMSVAKQFGGLASPDGKAVFMNTLSELGYRDMAEQYAGMSVGGNSGDSLKRLDQILDLKDKNIDPGTGKPRDEDIARLLDEESAKITGTPPGQSKEKITLADMLGGYPQDQDRKGWFSNFGDDTISVENVKQGAQNYLEWQKLQGIDESKARDQVKKEYAEMTSKEKGLRQKYPKLDIGQMFDDKDKRVQAIDEGKAVVVDMGDGVDTTPDTLRNLGIDDPETAEQFASLETMVGKALPEMDLRNDYKQDPAFYQKLFTAIKAGVPDKKNPGQTRKLSIAEIIELIKGE